MMRIIRNFKDFMPISDSDKNRTFLYENMGDMYAPKQGDATNGRM